MPLSRTSLSRNNVLPSSRFVTQPPASPRAEWLYCIFAKGRPNMSPTSRAFLSISGTYSMHQRSGSFKCMVTGRGFLTAQKGWKRLSDDAPVFFQTNKRQTAHKTLDLTVRDPTPPRGPDSTEPIWEVLITSCRAPLAPSHCARCSPSFVLMPSGPDSKSVAWPDRPDMSRLAGMGAAINGDMARAHLAIWASHLSRGVLMYLRRKRIWV